MRKNYGSGSGFNLSGYATLLGTIKLTITDTTMNLATVGTVHRYRRYSIGTVPVLPMQQGIIDGTGIVSRYGT